MFKCMSELILIGIRPQILMLNKPMFFESSSSSTFSKVSDFIKHLRPILHSSVKPPLKVIRQTGR